MKLKYRLIWLSLALAIIIAIGLFKLSPVWFVQYKQPQNAGHWGVTFSKKFATSIGLDWQEAYLATIDDLKVRQIRLPIYWDNLESIEGNYSYNEFDWMLDQGAQRDVKFILAIGRRLPRWPECHQPEWLKNYGEAEARQRLLRMLTQVVKRYKDRDNVIAWQVENEPLLDSFGECPKGDYNLLRQEVELVRSLDDRPIMITGSGELSDWKREAKLGDYFGTTLYRTVWNPLLGYIHYPWSPYLYTTKGQISGLNPDHLMVAELQAEPWAPNSTLDKLETAEANKSFTIKDFQSNIMYTQKTGFGKTYLWGVEWWYLQYKRGNKDFWNLAKQLPW